MRRTVTVVIALILCVLRGTSAAAQPADFGFRFESTGVGCLTERLDTFSGMFTYTGPFTNSTVAIPLQTLTAHIALTDVQMSAINRTIEDIRFFDYSSAFRGVPEGLQSVTEFHPSRKYRMEVQNRGAVHTVVWDDGAKPTTEKADRLRNLFSMVLGFIHEHSEFKRFSRPMRCGE
jgi:hypothetical protein